jgi:hypothetical protein
VVALRAKFDGQKIEVPDELRGAAPREVLIVYSGSEDSAPAGSGNHPSIWDVFGKAVGQRGTDEINAQVRTDRDCWDKR